MTQKRPRIKEPTPLILCGLILCGLILCGLTAGCGPERAGTCFLEEATYQITYDLKSSDCEPDVIQPQWTDEREIAESINCGSREQTFKKYIGAGCWEECTEKQQVETTGFTGTMTCDMACGGKDCRYETSLSAVAKPY